MSYYMYIVETKTEYTNQLVNILSPSLYEGIFSIYSDAANVSNNEDMILVNFQNLLKNVPKWNQNIITNETNRIIYKCNHGNLIEDLIKAVIKSNIMILTNTPPEKHSKLRIKHNITTEIFIHNCYTEVARNIFNNPFLLYQNYPPYELKKNQRETSELIKNCIKEAIRKMLPLNLILKEYIGECFPVNDMTDFDNPISESESKKVKKMLSKDNKDNENKFILVKTESQKNYKPNIMVENKNNIQQINNLEKEKNINIDKQEQKNKLNSDKQEQKNKLNSDKQDHEQINKLNSDKQDHEQKNKLNSDKQDHEQKNKTESIISIDNVKFDNLEKIENNLIDPIINASINMFHTDNKKIIDETDASECYYLQAQKNGICENYNNGPKNIDDPIFMKDKTETIGNSIIMSSYRDMTKYEKNSVKNNNKKKYFRESNINI